jgi:hypothetical protein
MNHNQTQIEFDAATVVRRCLFFLLIIVLTLGNLFLLFRGLDTPEAMDQAQIARQIARSQGFTTKFIRPAAYAQKQQSSEPNHNFERFKDTYNSPLNPLITAAVFKIVGADTPGKWNMSKEQLVYGLDRVVAGISTMFFLLSIGITYLLAVRIFDGKIAGVTALLMLCCDLMWKFSLSGLPQMLMLFLFSSALYFAYRALNQTLEGKMSIAPAILAGFCFAFLALANAITIWILLGYLIFAAIAFKPKGLIALVVALITLAFFAIPMWRNYQISGSIFGAAYLEVYNGLGQGDGVAMRTLDLQSNTIGLQGILLRLVTTMVIQITNILPFMGSIFVAPVFFLSLLHPFKRLTIARFRWAILLMWVLAVLGMSIFGVSVEGLHPNQIHILFAPIMTAYGLAMISILWNKLDFVASIPSLRNTHYIIVVVLTAIPLFLGSIDQVRYGLMRGEQGRPQWPPYLPSVLEGVFSKGGMVKESEIIVSDQPWAVAWYGDRMSLWIPRKLKDFNELEDYASEVKQPIAGILITPSSFGLNNMTKISMLYDDFTSLILSGPVMQATKPNELSTFDKDQKLQNLVSKYKYPIPLIGREMIYYSANPQRLTPN